MLAGHSAVLLAANLAARALIAVRDLGCAGSCFWRTASAYAAQGDTDHVPAVNNFTVKLMKEGKSLAPAQRINPTLGCRL
jgi:hypothetical protein